MPAIFIGQVWPLPIGDMPQINPYRISHDIRKEYDVLKRIGKWYFQTFLKITDNNMPPDTIYLGFGSYRIFDVLESKIFWWNCDKFQKSIFFDKKIIKNGRFWQKIVIFGHFFAIFWQKPENPEKTRFLDPKIRFFWFSEILKKTVFSKKKISPVNF